MSHEEWYRLRTTIGFEKKSGRPFSRSGIRLPGPRQCGLCGGRRNCTLGLPLRWRRTWSSSGTSFGIISTPGDSRRLSIGHPVITADKAFWWLRAGEQFGGRIDVRDIADVAATALAYSGISPSGLDGRPIQEIAGDMTGTRIVQPSERTSVTLRDEDEDSIAEHLRGLGYIE